jgi:hypothetical protein
MGSEVSKMAESEQGQEGVQAESKVIRDYLAQLSEECRMLAVLKKQIYGGSWEPMLDDLRNRLTGKPYIFKLANRIQDDIERIEEMSSFERDNGIDLSNYVELS